ncbi:MAG: NADP-dependent malic enzyme [Acholeplasmataceae bacterium]|nr:NADP-dependent malic enzyme [Acholeplasmataceae bacterium]
MQNPLKAHEMIKGKIEVVSRVKVESKDDLSTYYTPGVAEPCLEIEKDSKKSYLYTRRQNMIAVITDGSAVLGLGNIGAEASMPVMEGKSMLFKTMADVDAIPLSIDTQDTNELIRTITYLSKNFAGINLEDISAPRCFEIEKTLNEILDIPVFHDDQHGTAIVLYAALSNALKLVDKKIEDVKIVINGAGAAGTAITEFLLDAGAKHILVCDKEGILNENDETLNEAHLILAHKTNRKHVVGKLVDAMKDSDVFIGVSKGHLVTKDMINSMSDQPIIFPMANPTPEISVEDLYETKAYIIGTGSSKYPNQINNLLAFPGIFRGTLDSHAKKITKEMMLSASLAIASSIIPSIYQIIPDALDPLVHKNVANAVYETAIKQRVPKTHE